MNRLIRTDLAMEAQEVWKEGAKDTDRLPGVESREEQKGSFRVTTVDILDAEGEKALCKPIGRYVTMELDGLIRREENAFADAAELLAEILRDMLSKYQPKNVLVAGLGNPAITPDAVGPRAVDSVMVTRHLKERMPKDFAAFNNVSAIRAGVLGTTGMESADIVSAVAARSAPELIVAVDALASRRLDRLCRTVQISDTGITPGSGVGNARSELSQHTLGTKVVAIGVPTVVDAVTLAVDLAAKAGNQMEPSAFGTENDMIVTPRDVDRSVSDVAKLIGYGVNLALHQGLTLADIDMFLS